MKMFTRTVAGCILVAGIAGTSARAQTSVWSEAVAPTTAWHLAPWDAGVPGADTIATIIYTGAGAPAHEIANAAVAKKVVLGSSNGNVPLVLLSGGSLTVDGGNGIIVAGSQDGGSGSGTIVVRNNNPAIAHQVLNVSSAMVNAVHVTGGISGTDKRGYLTITNQSIWTHSAGVIIAGSHASGGAETGTLAIVKGGLLRPNQNLAMGGNEAADSARLILKEDGVLMLRAAFGLVGNQADSVVEWHGGTIRAQADVVATPRLYATVGTLTVELSDSGINYFDASAGKVITNEATARMVDRTGQAGTITKIGAGLWVVLGENTHSGKTLIQEGSLLIDHQNSFQNSTVETTGNHQLLFHNPTAVSFGGLNGSGALALTNAAGSAVTLSVGGNDETTAFSGVINTGDLGAGGSLVKVGSGTLTLSANNLYKGTTDVQAGKLVVNGAHSGGGLIIVRNGAELGGDGQVGHVLVEAGGVLSPGNSIGTFETGDLTLQGGAKLVMELSGTTSDADKITVAQLAYDGFGTIVVDLFGGKANTTYTLIGYTSLNNISLTDFEFNEDNLGSGLSVGSTSLASNELQLTIIPEPASMGALGFLAVVAILRRRLRRT